MKNFKVLLVLFIGLFSLISLGMARENEPPRILSVEGEVFLKENQAVEKGLILEEGDILFTKNGRVDFCINENVLRMTENSRVFISKLGEKPVISLQEGKLEIDVENTIEIWAANKMFSPSKGQWEIRSAQAEMISLAAQVQEQEVTEQQAESETAKEEKGEEYRRPFPGLGFFNWGFGPYWWYNYYWYWYRPIYFWSSWYSYYPWFYGYNYDYYYSNYSNRGYRNYYDSRTRSISRRQLQDPNRRQAATNLVSNTRSRISSATNSKTTLKAYPSRMSRNTSFNKSIPRISPSNRSINRSLSPNTSRISRSSNSSRSSVLSRPSTLSRSSNSLRSYAPTRTFSAQPRTFSAPSRSSVSTSFRASAPRSVSSQSRGGSTRRK